MECRVPVAFQIATGDDARSEGQPSHPLLLRLKKGEVRERPNRAVSKTAVPLRGPWVRIPPSPPYLARETSVLNGWAVARQLYRRVTKFHHREKVSLSRQRRFFAPYQASLEPPPSIIWGRIVTLPPGSLNTFA